METKAVSTSSRGDTGMELNRALKLIKEGYTFDGVDYRELNESAILGMTAIAALLLGSIWSASKSHKAASDRKVQLHSQYAKEHSGYSKEEKETFLKNNPKDRIINEMKADVRKMVQKLKSDDSVKAKCKKSLAEDGLEKDSYSITYVDNGDYIEIIEGSQEVNESLSWIIDDLVSALKTKYADAIKYKVVELSSGDGDEGCLYIE
jgi:hypothetical protein